MIDEVATAVATGAAGNVIAHLLTGRADALRTRVAAVFRRGTAQQRTEALTALEHDRAALAERRESETAVAARWTDRFLTQLDAHPEARGDVEALAAGSPSRVIGAQHNHGSGVFVGGDNHGGITVTGPR
ncbi:hypothetical protein [Kitasatospora sp. NPDC059327]|uniref:hypothetical protein n=1 Tax=Kitasatospora sp. NPDC059327 TaxID=3346803 RepID=UPI0036B7BB35